VLAAVILTVILVAGLVFYAMHRSKPSRLRLSASLLKLVSFSIEVESQDERLANLVQHRTSKVPLLCTPSRR
jgi:hypothetical protein